ncbi:uncharacterized protein [Venturia canescens]|uniref:uncharacterized protein isoform X2 n=1 Tax=Venturia canescens TaxID=32260 RepID=UPI001C9D63CE|nr:uncharacterized protein LOC122415628 isoform X2 [Venturia canescens]
MNRENDERAVSQTLCGALQKEANCKCLVLSVLIYGCLAAVTWCRCANVTKVVINFDNYPLKRTEHVSPCDEGYIYIPVAFMGMLYLVYLVECYHSPIRIDLFHAESQDNVMTKLSQLRLAQPTIWWKAVSYHYVRRKRQITRYRNGDNYTTTQVYYERANTHAATSFYFYEYCGVKDISKELTTEPKIPITKITLTKGFAFSNMRSATEFEEARSRFFAEQELRDDYMEMREGLDLGYNFNPTSVVGILGNPWFTNSYVYWCFSALLLSWPLRIIIEYNTQYADYQVTKLFGVNYDTPSSGDQIHESSSQLSAPGSYMLAPSYSEALLMDPSPMTTNCQSTEESSNENLNRDIVPSYSEALLYERAQPDSSFDNNAFGDDFSGICDCYCHVSSIGDQPNAAGTTGENSRRENARTSSASCLEIRDDYEAATCSRCGNNNESNRTPVNPNDANLDRNARRGKRFNSMENSWSCYMMREQNRGCRLTRDLSAPNFSTHCEFAAPTNNQFLRLNENSLENISENEEPVDASSESNGRVNPEDSRARPEVDGVTKKSLGCGTIPKYKGTSSSGETVGTSNGYRLIENPMIDDETQTRSSDEDPEANIPSSKTYFCLKSILKQHRRRYTLVTAEELEKFAADELVPGGPARNDRTAKSSRDNKRPPLFVRDHFFWRNKADGSSAQSTSSLVDQKIQRVSSSRSLIFPSPIEEACRTMPNDPFGGKAVHVMASRSMEKPPDYDEATSLPRFTKLARSLTSIQYKSMSVDSPQRVRTNRIRNPGERRHRRNLSIEPEYLMHACRRSKKVDESVKSEPGDYERGIVASCSIETEVETHAPNSAPMPIQLRRNFTRGFSLYDSKTDRKKRTKFLRTSLTETSESASSFSFNDEPNAPPLEPNSSSSKRFNLSMETSL